jgi:hypothetical protein
VGIRSWLQGLRKREDAAALKRAEEEQLESPEERRISEGDVEGMQADEQAGLAWGETPEGADRLAERDDE